jgi:oligopeptidase B
VVEATRTWPPVIEAPRAACRPSVHSHHGHARIDDYAWLRDPNWLQVLRDPSLLSAEIREHLEAENRYCRTAYAPLQVLRERLRAEIALDVAPEDFSSPLIDGPYAYYQRYARGASFPHLCRRALPDGPEEELLDLEVLSARHATLAWRGVRHSPDHAHLAVAIDVQGDDVYDIRIYRLAPQVEGVEVLADTSGELAWAADGSALFYVRVIEGRPREVYRHALGTPHREDALVYSEDDPAWFVRLALGESGRHVVITSASHSSSEVWLVPAGERAPAPMRVAERRPGSMYRVADGGRDLFILHDDGAPDFQISRAPRDASDRSRWELLVPHRPGVFLAEMTAVQGYLVWLEKREGLGRLVCRRLSDGSDQSLTFDAEESYELSLEPPPGFAARAARASYSSLRTPPRVFEWDLEHNTRSTLEPSSGLRAPMSDARLLRLWAPATDGERIPVTLLLPAPTPAPDLPVLLCAYGAYGRAAPARFSEDARCLASRGIAYAIAHVRGGDERGRRWHEAARGKNRATSFSDYLAAALHLVAEGYTRPGLIVCHGASAGGTLVGAVLNARPDLFAGAVAEVPFVDVLSASLDAALPLTPREWVEWGNPLASADDYRAILAYSPVDNVRPARYPPILATAGVTDSRVPYWEAAKWVARLRANQLGDAPILLSTDLASGHAGRGGRRGRLEASALRNAFVIAAVERAARGREGHP